MTFFLREEVLTHPFSDNSGTALYNRKNFEVVCISCTLDYFQHLLNVGGITDNQSDNERYSQVISELLAKEMIERSR